MLEEMLDVINNQDKPGHRAALRGAKEVKPDGVIVVEDSKNGVAASKTAGIKTIITNHYTEKEEVNAGDIIVSCLGDLDGEKASLRKGDLNGFDGVIHVKQLMELFG